MAPLKKVHYSDLLLLRNLFCGQDQEMVIYDPLTCVSEAPAGLCVRDPGALTSMPNYPVIFNFSYDLYPEKAEALYIFHFNLQGSDSSKKFRYINNPDGTMRWIYEAEAKKPYFLELYNSGTLKGRLYKQALSLAFSSGFGSHFASGSFILQQKNKNKVEQVVSGSGAETYCIFTGTKGENRKSIISIHGQSQTTHFIKIAFQEAPRNLIKNELQMLTTLSKYDFTALSLPQPSGSIDPSYAKMTNIKPKATISANRLRDVHIKALAELYLTNHETRPIQNSSAWETISNQLHLLDKEHEIVNDLDATTIYNIIRNLFSIFNSIDPNVKIPVSFAHGDFTPWNMYTDDHRLYLYDWELAGAGMPMLMDLFHFIFQSQVLLFRKDYHSIASSIQDALKNTYTTEIIKTYQIDVNLHYKLYLLFTVTYYTRLYIHQKPLHSQAHWLINTWNHALHELQK